MMLALLLLAAGPGCGAASTQVDMSTCADADRRRADAALNRQWRRTLARQGEAGRGKLIAAERAWIVYRDAQCEAETAGSLGGSMHGMAVAACVSRITRQRTGELAAMIRE